ncbi:MAG: hypothetical protein KGN33_11485 [Paracoccaceae bacterium]|nr:hypothetical protein [Paracoccaceae bacterium]
MRAVLLALLLFLGVVIANLPGAAAARGTMQAEPAHGTMTMGRAMPCPACDGMGAGAHAGTCLLGDASCASAPGCGMLALALCPVSARPRPRAPLTRPPLVTVAAQSAFVPEPPPPRR